MIRRSLLLLAASLVATSSAAQVEYGGSPARALAGTVPTISLEPPDHAALRAEDALRPKGALRFGVVQPVDAGLEDGSWIELPGGDRVWRLRIESRGAYSLSLLFSRFQLSEGAELFVHDDSRRSVRGAYTWLNNKPNGQFAVQPTAGDALTLEYYEPASIRGSGELALAAVVHDYLDFLSLEGPALESGPCNVDVNCPEGDPWRTQIDSTVQIIAGGFLCSAMLINNTANDGRQLVMSANHCGNYDNAVFRFNFQRSGCDTGSSPTNQTVQGSNLIAAGTAGDFRLVEVIPPIPASYGPYYSGWNRGPTAPTSAFGVHHPSGDPKKISFEDDPLVRSGNFWTVTDWDVGTTEGGSSGSPLFDPNGRFVGQLCCGLAACGNDLSDSYGALNAYWASVAAALDPLGTGATTLDGFDPDSICPVPAQAVATTRNGTGLNPALLVQTSPAVLGTTWDAAVDVVAIDGQASVLLIGLGGPLVGGFPLGGVVSGELLCLGPFLRDVQASGLHSVGIANSCALVGTSFCTQAGVVKDGKILLTNALDVTIGTF